MRSPLAINVYGMGHVGIMTALSFFRWGHRVKAYEKDAKKAEALSAGRLPFVEAKLDEAWARAVADESGPRVSRLSKDFAHADVHVICVGTPATAQGALDLSQIQSAVELIGENLRRDSRPTLILNRCTVPPGTLSEVIVAGLERVSERRHGVDFFVAGYPEFLREGAAIEDEEKPALRVIGTGWPAQNNQPQVAFELLQRLFDLDQVTVMASAEAELLKLACNAFHATKVAFANEIGAIAAKYQVDGQRVMEVFKQDTKLNCSGAYLKPGFMFGGPCLEKDLSGLCLAGQSKDLSLPLLSSVAQSNREVGRRLLIRINQAKAKRIGVVGAGFKRGTSDIRGSSLIELLSENLAADCELYFWQEDPAGESAYSHLKSRVKCQPPMALEGILAACDLLIVGAVKLDRTQRQKLENSRVPIIDLGY